MSSGKSGSSQNQSKNIYGTLAGAICWGPLDWITAVVHNGSYLWQGSLDLTEDVTDLTGAIADPSYIAPGGYLRIYRGTETQEGDPAIPNEPCDKGTVKIVAKHIFFGQNTGSAPNLQVIGGRLPRVPTSIVAAEDNVRDDDQVNPIAALAEFLLDERGAGFDLAQMDAASWLAAAAWCAQDAEHRAYTFCSPLITEQLTIRDALRQLVEPFNGILRWTSDLKLACHIYEWGSDPGGLNVLDARQWTAKPNIPQGDWSDVPTEVLVNFVDRAYEFQENTALVSNARGYQVRQVDDQRRIDRKHVTRIAQAHRQVVEYLRRVGTAPSTFSVRVRAAFAESLLIGDKIKIDVDAEPGGAGLAQLVRVERIERNRTEEAIIEVMTDNLVPASVYTPTWIPEEPVDEVSPPLEHYLGVPLPPNAFGWPPSVGILATRPDPKILGFDVYFSTAADGSYANLGQQAGFAVRGELDGSFDDEATSLAITQLDGLDAPDAGLAANTPGGNTTAAADNVLLAIIAQLDGDGQIELGEDGDPLMEFVSIVDRAFVSGATHNYTVLRGRLGTQAREWADGATVWIVPRVNLTAWRHSLLSAMLGGVAFFRLVSFTAKAEDESLPVPQLGVNMLPADAPSYGGNIDGDTNPDDGPAPNPVSAVTVTPSLSLLVLKWTNPTNVPLRKIFIYESSDLTRPLKPQFGLDPDQTFLFRTGLGASETKYFWIEVQGQNGRRTLSGPYDGTTRAGVDLSDIVPGMQLVGIVSALPDPDGYDIDENPQVLFLTTNKKLYRYDVGTTTWTSEIDGYDLVAGSILAGAISAGAVTATAVGTNLIITTTANIGTAVITDANILSITAEKIVAGVMDAMILRAGKMATDYVVFNSADVARTMPVSGYLVDEDDNGGPGWVTLGSVGTDIWMHSFVGWLGGSAAFAKGRFGKSTVLFDCDVNGGGVPAVGDLLCIEIICRINLGTVFQVNNFQIRTPNGNGGFSLSAKVELTGLTGTDVVEFGIRAKSILNDPTTELSAFQLGVEAKNI